MPTSYVAGLGQEDCSLTESDRSSEEPSESVTSHRERHDDESATNGFGPPPRISERHKDTLLCHIYTRSIEIHTAMDLLQGRRYFDETFCGGSSSCLYTAAPIQQHTALNFN